jgi:hypothetical protein
MLSVLQVGQCLKFDGSKHNHAILPTLDFRDLVGFSVVFWLKYAGDNKAVNPMVFSLQSEDKSHTVSFGKWGSSTHASFQRENAASLVIPSGFSCCEWMHYTVIFRRLPQAEVVVFKNGVQVQICRVPPGQTFEQASCDLAQSYDYPSQALTSNYLARSHEAHPYLSGRIDSFGVFPWPLSITQISAVYNANVPKKMASAVLQVSCCFIS